MDIISYILSRKYTDNSIVGLGAIKGANCTVKDIVHQDGINTVTFEWVGTDGTTKTRDMVVYDGTPIYVWESGNTYHYGDLAIYESQFYRCIVENNDVVFDNTKWNEIGSPDGNYDIVQSKALLPARFTAADRKLYFVIDEHIFYLWDGTQWVGQTCLVQEETMPIASAKYLGRIYQYIGTTDTNFVHGYCYECVSDGANPPTYSWVSVGNSPIFTGTQAQWDSLTLAQQNVYKFVNIIGDEQNINLGIYLRKVNSMPNAEDCPSETVMYVGTTTANYVKGYIYCSVPSVVNGETVYNWVRQDTQPYIQADWEQTNSSAHDYIKHKPTLGTASAKNYTSNVRPNNTDLVESHAVYSAINSALSSIYVPRGELSCAELTSDLLIPANVGNVYTMSDSGTTSALFINGAGHSIAVNDNVGIIRAGGDTILFNLMGNAFDLHDYQTKELETPLTIDGTQETEVEDALSGLNEGLNNKVSYEYQGKVGAKNLLIYPYYIGSRTSHGITWDSTVTNDGRVVVNGQADGYSNYEMYYDGTSQSIDLKLEAGDYIASIGGCNNNENIMLRIRLVYPDPETGTTVTKANVTRQTQYKVAFNISDQEANDLANGISHFEGRVYYPAASTEVFDNLIVSPMLRYAEDSSDTWEPYAKTNKELTDGLSNLVSTLNVTNISEKKIDITAFGGKADVNSSNNSQLLISAITYAMANGYTLYVPQGIYYIKSGVEITNDLKIEGVTTYGQSGQRVGSVINFSPQANDVTLFYDNGSHNVSLKNVQFFCGYTHFTKSFEEVAESPHAYLTWSYDYTDVNCLNIPNSLIDIYNVGISGFSGYAIKCKSNRAINNVKIGACKYGFYDCGADVIFHDCYLSQCEYAFYWLTKGAVVFSYDTWIDLCGYGYYSEKELSGEISGLIDHCLYAGICAKHTQAGLNFNGRMGRCGMYYTGTDMLEFLSGAFTEEKFIEATKGVFVAIRDATGLNLNINVVPRAIDDQNLGENKLPTLICYGQKFKSAIIKTSHNYGNHTYLVTNTAESHVNVINCDGSDTMVEFTAQELQAMW